MTVRLTFVHGNDDVIEEECNSWQEAQGRAHKIEQEKCGRGLLPMRKTFEVTREGFIQYGTGYHYVTMEEVLT